MVPHQEGFLNEIEKLRLVGSYYYPTIFDTYSTLNGPAKLVSPGWNCIFTEEHVLTN